MTETALGIPSSKGHLLLEQRRRSVGLDALRGLAILLMMVDHVAYVAGPEWQVLRESVGRLALPLFFVLGGHLASRWAWRRQLPVLGVGLVVGVLVPWSGAFELLLSFTLGVLLVSRIRRSAAALGLLVAFGLTLGANGYAQLVAGPVGTGYAPACLLGLMALGALLPRTAFGWTRRLPALLALLGRRPLTVYAGHLLLLELVRLG
jgi:surface polysaccharide O-acyltransferase-like enzyme